MREAPIDMELFQTDPDEWVVQDLESSAYHPYKRVKPIDGVHVTRSDGTNDENWRLVAVSHDYTLAIVYLPLTAGGFPPRKRIPIEKLQKKNSHLNLSSIREPTFSRRKIIIAALGTGSLVGAISGWAALKKLGVFDEKPVDEEENDR